VKSGKKSIFPKIILLFMLLPLGIPFLIPEIGLWGFPDKTDSPELGFLTKSQFYSKSHNSRFFKPPFALNSFV
jgi:hypothetical protein